jgi:ArsR family transcriptional regulator, arsenate/arsenite/antimonite-responsive transcriptional repressor
MAVELQEIKLSERPWRESRCCAPAPEKAAVPAAGEVEALKALADETRLAIVRMLAEHDEPLCVCHIVDAFDLSQPTISHHLRLLREAGLISSEKRGLWAYYSLRRERLASVAQALTNPIVGVLPYAPTTGAAASGGKDNQ